MPDHEEVSSDDCPDVSGVAAAPGNQGSASRPAESDPLRRLLSEFSALREYAAHLAATYVDLTRARARKLVISAILGIAAAIVGLTVAIACAIHTVRGVAGGLAAAVAGGSGWVNCSRAWLVCASWRGWPESPCGCPPSEGMRARCRNTKIERPANGHE